MKIDRIQRSREKGAKLPPNTLCITRPSQFGNPFKKKYANENNYRVVKLFKEWLYKPEQYPLRIEFIEWCKRDGIKHLACCANPRNFVTAIYGLNIWWRCHEQLVNTPRFI